MLSGAREIRWRDTGVSQWSDWNSQNIGEGKTIVQIHTSVHSEQEHEWSDQTRIRANAPVDEESREWRAKKRPQLAKGENKDILDGHTDSGTQREDSSTEGQNLVLSLLLSSWLAPGLDSRNS